MRNIWLPVQKQASGTYIVCPQKKKLYYSSPNLAMKAAKALSRKTGINLGRYECAQFTPTLEKFRNTTENGVQDEKKRLLTKLEMKQQQLREMNEKYNILQKHVVYLERLLQKNSKNKTTPTRPPVDYY